MMDRDMDTRTIDKQASVLMTHEVGLHARPSVKLTKLAKSFQSAIEIAAAAEGPWIDAKSIVKVMAMKAKQGHDPVFPGQRGGCGRGPPGPRRTCRTRFR